MRTSKRRTRFLLKMMFSMALRWSNISIHAGEIRFGTLKMRLSLCVQVEYALLRMTADDGSLGSAVYWEIKPTRERRRAIVGGWLFFTGIHGWKITIAAHKAVWSFEEIPSQVNTLRMRMKSSEDRRPDNSKLYQRMHAYRHLGSAELRQTATLHLRYLT